MKIGYMFDIMLAAAIVTSLILWNPQALCIFMLCGGVFFCLGAWTNTILYTGFNGATKIVKGHECEFGIILFVKLAFIALMAYGITLLFH